MFRWVRAMTGRKGYGPTTKRGKALLSFYDETEVLKGILVAGGVSVLDVVEWLYEHTGMNAAIQRSIDIGTLEEREHALGREQLRSAFMAICPREQSRTPLAEIGVFLDVLAVSASSSEEEDERKVVLSTIHSAKGREWDHVWIAGFSEGIIPHVFASTEPGRWDAELEEERRAAYVALTRARLRMVICRCRWIMGRDGVSAWAQESRFAKELDAPPEGGVEPLEPEVLASLEQEQCVSWIDLEDPPWKLAVEQDTE